LLLKLGLFCAWEVSQGIYMEYTLWVCEAILA
jgi:hypothetical protein